MKNSSREERTNDGDLKEEILKKNCFNEEIFLKKNFIK